MATTALVHATVVYCTPSQSHVIAVAVPPGTTLKEAVMGSGITCVAPELDGVVLDLGVFNRPSPGGTPVRPGDRIEVYRPLTVDPKAARRVRAEVKRRRERA